MQKDADTQKAKEPSVSYDKKLTYEDYLNFDFSIWWSSSRVNCLRWKLRPVLVIRI